MRSVVSVRPFILQLMNQLIFDRDIFERVQLMAKARRGMKVEVAGRGHGLGSGLGLAGTVTASV